MRGSNPRSPANLAGAPRGGWRNSRLAGGPVVFIGRRQILLPRRRAQPVVFTLILGAQRRTAVRFAHGRGARFFTSDWLIQSQRTDQSTEIRILAPQLLY